MTSCRCAHLGSVFTSRLAERELRRYRKRGPGGATAALIDALRARGVSGCVLLDVGGGVGALQHELLELGASRAISVDAAPDYRVALLAEAERRGHRAQISTFDGDFVELAPSIEAADLVTLDKVICCDPELEALVGAAAGRAERLVGLVYPREAAPIRLAAALLNGCAWALRKEFRWFVHPVAALDATLRRAGFTRAHHERRLRLLPWEVAVYERAR